MNKHYQYFYTNTTKNPDIKNDLLFEGESIIYKADDIKSEDKDGNVERNMKLYVTNFRILTINTSKVFDLPLPLIKNNYVSKPMLFGSPYICAYINQGNRVAPYYIREQLGISSVSFNYPEYIMIKFKDKSANLNNINDIIKSAIRNKDFDRSYKKSDNNNNSSTILTNSNTHNNHNTHNTHNTNTLYTFGIQKAVNNMDNRLKNNQNLISSSFSDTNSLRQNASQLIEIGSQLKSKLDKADENEAIEIHKMLQKIGYIDPVTKEQTGKEYHKELAFQLNSFFEEYFKNNEGIITLIDAYCIYNRARGMSKSLYIIL